MINCISRIALCCSVLFFVSCAPLMQGDSKFVACKSTCENRLKACAKVCRNNCPRCLAAAAQSTARNYAHYVKERSIKGEIIALQLNSFRDPLQCRKTTCNCRADYQICIQSCGGIIHKRLQYVSLCS